MRPCYTTRLWLCLCNILQMSMLEDPTEDCYGADGESEDELNFKRLAGVTHVLDCCV